MTCPPKFPPLGRRGLPMFDQRPLRSPEEAQADRQAILDSEALARARIARQKSTPKSDPSAPPSSHQK